MRIKNRLKNILKIAVPTVLLFALFTIIPALADGFGANDYLTVETYTKPIQLESPKRSELQTTTKHLSNSDIIREIESNFDLNTPPITEKKTDNKKSQEKITHPECRDLEYIDSFFVPTGYEIAMPETSPENTSGSKDLIPLEEILGNDINPEPDKPQKALVRPEPVQKTLYEEVAMDYELKLEGKTIKHIYVDGLKTISEKIVLDAIKTKVGNPFNEELIQQDLQNIYATGYFQDSMAVNPIMNADNTVDLVYVVRENLIIKDVAIVGNTVIPTSELLKLVEPLKGSPQNIDNINVAIADIENLYKSEGYILGGVQDVNDDENGVLTFTISEGIINKFIIEGNEKTKDYVITRNMMTQPGTVYNENYLKEDISKLYATNLFKDVSREILPAEDGESGKYDLKISVKEASSNNIAIGMGIDSGLGLFGSLGLNENNFMGRGQKVSLNGIIGSGVLLSDASIKRRINYQTELSFFEPYFLNENNSLMAKMYFRELGSFQVPLAIERRFGLMSSVEHKVKGIENLSTGIGFGFENIHLKEGDFKKIASMYANSNINIAKRKEELAGGSFLNLAPSIKYCNLDDEELPRDGIVAQARFIEAFSIDNIHKTNGRIAGSVTKYIPVFEKSSLALTGRGGMKVHGDRMPEVMAFSLGGPYSMRGFKMSGVGSGEGFIMGSAELSTPIPYVDRLKYDFFKKLRLTFFIDAGSVFDETISSKLYDRPLHAISGGVGIKVFIPKIGPISVDYGIPFTHTGKYGPKHGYFTFGTGGYDLYGY